MVSFSLSRVRPDARPHLRRKLTGGERNAFASTRSWTTSRCRLRLLRRDSLLFGFVCYRFVLCGSWRGRGERQPKELAAVGPTSPPRAVHLAPRTCPSCPSEKTVFCLRRRREPGPKLHVRWDIGREMSQDANPNGDPQQWIQGSIAGEEKTGRFGDSKGLRQSPRSSTR